MDDKLAEIAGRWYATGLISTSERQLLKAQYLLEIDEDPPCKTCDTFWFQVRHHFAMQLKNLNLLPVKKPIQKYRIKGGWLQLPSSTTLIVNDGVDSEDRQVLTDEVAEQILKDNPSYKTLIEINPEWQVANPEEDQNEEDSDKDQDDEPAETVSKADHEKLQADHEEAIQEVNRLRGELSATKGRLTKATNDLAKLKNTTTADPVQPEADPAISTATTSTPPAADSQTV